MRFKPSIRVAFAAVVIVLISSAVGFRASVSALNLYLRKESVPLRDSLDTIPMKLGRWKRVGVDSRLGEAMVESLGTRFYLDRHYAIDGNPANGVMTLHIAYYTGMIDAMMCRCSILRQALHRHNEQRRMRSVHCTRQRSQTINSCVGDT